MGDIYGATNIGSIDEVMQSLELGAWDPSRLLRHSSRVGDLNVVRALLPFGANVNATDRAGWTSLHEAAYYGHQEVVEFLLGNGASVDVYDKNSFKPIHWAIINRHEGIVKALIEAGDDVHAGVDGGTPLYLAVQSGSLAIVKMLIEAGAEVCESSFHKLTPLHLAACNGLPQIAKFLLDHGSRVDAVCQDNQTPLHYACASGNEETARVLIDAGADVHCHKTKGAIHYAAGGGHEGTIRLVINSGAPVNVRCDNNNDTPLHIAAAEGHDDAVKALLEHGANPELFNDPFHQIPLHLAASKGHKKTVEILLKKKANVNALDLEGSTALHLAAYHGCHEVVDVLLDSGADVKLVCTRGRTALHSAFYLGNNTVITSLLEHVLEFNAPVNYNSIIASCLEDGLYIDAHLTEECCSQLYENKIFNSCISKVFEMHFIKMKSAGLCPPEYVQHREMPLGLDESSRQQYQTACDQEVALTKTTKIGDSECSYYRLFQNSEAVCQNENSVRTLQVQDLKKDFNIYGRLLNISFKQGLERRILLNECYRFFSVVFRVDLHFDILEMIFRYLTLRDLKNLSSIFDRKR